MRAPPRPCRKCGAKAIRSGLCQRHYTQQDQRRGTSTQRGYGHEHRDRFRAGVLERDPVCPCGAPAVHADHHPLTRRELVANGLDPNDPKHGRGLCHSCHSRVTMLALAKT